MLACAVPVNRVKFGEVTVARSAICQSTAFSALVKFSRKQKEFQIANNVDWFRNIRSKVVNRWNGDGG